ncbi:DegT/DnrJ/EryC1/StrS family aminotransferase [Pseudoalteromonas rubra]|nr:DegT/DnrJ/EryC1/StrS family aminotransferase [Pseudoalteromonas rubra]
MKDRIRFLDLSLEKDEMVSTLQAIEKALAHGQLIMGPEHDKLEELISTYCKRKYCVAVGSGTDALYLSFKALGIKHGDEVITTPLSWVASTHSFVMHGATPIFADIDETLNIDPESVEHLISDKTVAILAVDYAGHPADYKRLKEIANKYNIALIEDGSQAFGASIDKQPVGSFGLISCISMNPMKPLGAIGEAGVILTDDTKLYEKLIAARYSGMVDKQTCYEPSINCRMDTIHAAVLLERLPKYNRVMTKRQQIAQKYKEHLAEYVEFPVTSQDVSHAYYLFLFFTDKRDELFEFLNKNNIEARIRDNILIPSQPCYKPMNKNTFEKATKAADTLLAIPAHEKMNDNEVMYVIKKIKEFFKGEI